MAGNKIILYQGADTEFKVTINYSDGSPIDISGLQGLLIILYNRSEEIVAQYSKGTLSGYKDITTVDAANGIVKCYLERDVTSTAKEGDILIEVKVKFADTNYDNNDYETITRGQYLATIRKSLSKDITSY